MGVYIKGMKMPSSCYDCDCFIGEVGGTDYCYCCLLMRDIEDSLQKESDCPLVEIPPHGRLIDADAILNTIGELPYKGSVKRVLMQAPIIIPAEGGENL